MARKREFDTDQALDQVLQTFWSNGYEATSVDDLLQATGLSKSSFYGAFGSKHEIMLATLDRYIAEVVEGLVADLGRGTARAAIIRSFEKILSLPPGSKTCFLHVCAVEVAGRDQSARIRVRRGLDRLEEGYRDAVLRGQSTGEFRGGGDAWVLARFLVTQLYGPQVQRRANTGVDALRPAVDIALAVL